MFLNKQANKHHVNNGEVAPQGYQRNFLVHSLFSIVQHDSTQWQKLCKIFGGASAEGTILMGALQACSTKKFLKFGALKWHFQLSDSTFCKKFQVFKTLF